MLEHAGIEDAEPFTPQMISSVKGFNSKRMFKKREPDLSHLIPQLRQAFAKPEAELKALINEHWPELNFQGIPPEQ